jgi:prolipoprotein diacylglyceryltransferase
MFAYMNTTGVRTRTRATTTQIVELFAVFLISFFVGARLWFDCVTFLGFGGDSAARTALTNNLLLLFDPRFGGLSFHGGFLAALAACFFATRALGLRFLDLADEFCVFAPLVLAASRVATFFAGVDPGRLSSSAYGVGYSDAAGQRYPWQLIEALALVARVQVAVGAVHGLRNRFPGAVLLTFVTLYSVVRLVTENFREAISVHGLTVPQWTSIALICVVIVSVAIARFRR